MYPLPLEAFARLEVWALGHDGPVLLSVIAQALLFNYCVHVSLSPSLPVMPLMAVSGKSRLLSARFCTEAIIGVELPKEVFTSRGRWIFLIVEWNASTNMFYLLKHLLLLILVICKLKCNNLIFNKIMILNALYVCLHAFSLHRESPDPDPGR
jgi:hypothetical protein